MNENSLNLNEKKTNINPKNKKKFVKNNTINYFNTLNGKLNINSFAYLKLAKENQKFKKNIKLIKMNNTNSNSTNISFIDKNINNKNNNISIDKNNKKDNKESILFKKFIEYRNKWIKKKLKSSKNKTKKKYITPKTPKVKKENKNNLNLSSLNSSGLKNKEEKKNYINKNDIIKTTEINEKNKTIENDNKKSENKMKKNFKKSKSAQNIIKIYKLDDKEYQNLKNSSYSQFLKKKSSKFINQIELFNKIINSRIIKKNPGKSKRSNSCQMMNFNLETDIKIFEKQNKNKRNEERDFDLSNEIRWNNQTLDLKIKEYFKNLKSEKNQYYNEKNNIYICERRHRIEDKLNEILFEKYKMNRPLRMTKRNFFIEDNSKTNKNNSFDKKNYNKYNFNNKMNVNLNDILKNNYINSWNNFMNYSKDYYEKNNKLNKSLKINKKKKTNESRKIDDNDDKNKQNYSQVINYNNTINNIIKMRKFLSIEEFFNEIQRDYNLLDFNFSFLLENFKNK